MQKCRYKGNAIYAFNIKGKNDTINFQLEKEWKKAGENNQLSCEECGAPVIFRCGKIYIPHFAHKSDFQGNRICKYSTETEEHIAGKKLLLNYMLSLYSDAKGEMRYVLPGGKIADLYFRFNNGQQLVIEFQRLSMNTNYWDQKRDFHKKLGINSLWFISERTENIDYLDREINLSNFLITISFHLVVKIR